MLCTVMNVNVWSIKGRQLSNGYWIPYGNEKKEVNRKKRRICNQQKIVSYVITNVNVRNITEYQKLTSTRYLTEMEKKETN